VVFNDIFACNTYFVLDIDSSVARSAEAFTATSAQNNGHFGPLHANCEFLFVHQNVAHVLFDKNLNKFRLKFCFRVLAKKVLWLWSLRHFSFYHHRDFSGVIDTTEIVSVVSLTQLKSFQRCHIIPLHGS
jgi:hypothetical protein